MKAHEISGSFMAKFFGDKELKGTLDYPETFAEARQAVKDGYVLAKCDGKDDVQIPVTEASIFQDSYRGCSLRGQGNAPLTPEEKEERKENRKDRNAVLAEMKEEIERRIAEKKAAK